MDRAGESNLHFIDAAYSIGIDLREDGTISDTIEGMPAALAGIGPGMKLVAVNGRQYSPEILRDAIKTGKNTTAPLAVSYTHLDVYKRQPQHSADGEDPTHRHSGV